jgi:hypothetical protein
MKKITLIFAASLLSIGMFAQQTSVISDSGISLSQNVSIQNANQRLIGACDQGNSAGDINGAAGSNEDNGFMAAVDLIVVDGDVFTLEGVTARVLTLAANSSPSTATVTFFEDGGNGFPGAEIGSEAEISVNVISTAPWVNPAANVHEIEFNVAPFTFEGVSGSDTSYWVGIQVGNVEEGSTFFELAEDPDGIPENVLVGEPIVQRNPNTGSWGYIDFTDDGSDPEDDTEGFYSLIGDCLLSTNDLLLNDVSVYPNPANNILNVNIPSSLELSSANLYDVLGRNTGVAVANGEMNVSNLSSGVYILKLETSAGSLSKKVIIE